MVPVMAASLMMQVVSLAKCRNSDSPGLPSSSLVILAYFSSPSTKLASTGLAKILETKTNAFDSASAPFVDLRNRAASEVGLSGSKSDKGLLHFIDSKYSTLRSKCLATANGQR